jgi:hypothetical protein
MANVFLYNGEARPKWLKVFTASNGEEFSVELAYGNQTEREALTVEEVFAHLHNLLAYAKDKFPGSVLVEMGAPPSKTFIPLVGDFPEVDWALQQISVWWEWAYYNDAYETKEPA